MKKLITLKPALIACILFCWQLSAISQIPTSWGNQIIPAGSKIIDMGVTPQTVGNGLKPYGLIYDLIKNYNVPILWAIKSNKTKDAADFIQDGVTYRGGPFIIKAGFLTSSVNTAISSWITKGVIVRTTTTAGSIPIFIEINEAPVWVISTDNTAIPTGFLTDGGIPSSAYSAKAASALTICDNIYAMPHSDPTWATHNRLYSWVKSLDSTNGCQGWLWGGCHATSVLENLSNPALSWQKMNFLSTNGLVPFGSHNNGTPAYINDSFPSNPIMQFMSIIDDATTNGSEQIYLPALSSVWRSKTQIGVYDASQQNVPGLSPGKAAVMLYGPAFNDYDAGYVAYEAGHDVSGNQTENVAAERLFFNFSFLAPLMQVRTFNLDSYNIPDTIYTGNTQTLSVSVSGTTGPFTYQWSSTCAGAAFTAPTAATTNLTIPPSTGSCIVKCVVTSSCGKITFASKSVTLINIGVLPLELIRYSISHVDNKAKLHWEVENDADGLRYDIERSINGRDFSVIGSKAANASDAGTYDHDDASIDQQQAVLIYYRIRLIQKDGKQRIGPVMVLRMNNATLTRPVIRPNPASNYVKVNFYAAKAGMASFILLDAEGKEMFLKKISLNAGENSLFMDELNIYPGGMYTAVIITEHEKITAKFYILK